MFTGIVTEVGRVRELAAGEGVSALRIACSSAIADAAIGDSISVDGCCLTVTSLDGPKTAPDGFTAELMGETLQRTALGALGPGDPVNLEPALRADGRLGGHLVQGHVDGVGEVRSVRPDGAWRTLTVALPPGLDRYVVEKGSVTLQGVSLTVMAADRDVFSVGLIPHTLEATALGRLKPGAPVNVEVDVVAKYIESLLRGGAATPYGPKAHADREQGTDQEGR